MKRCVISQKARHSEHTSVCNTSQGAWLKRQGPEFQQGKALGLCTNWCALGLLSMGCGQATSCLKSELTFIFHSYAQFSVEETKHMWQRRAWHALALL